MLSGLSGEAHVGGEFVASRNGAAVATPWDVYPLCSIRSTFAGALRWKGENFRHEGANAPTGITFTVAAGRRFDPSIVGSFSSNRFVPNDLEAILQIVDAILDNFELVEGTKHAAYPSLTRAYVEVALAF